MCPRATSRLARLTAQLTHHRGYATTGPPFPTIPTRAHGKEAILKQNPEDIVIISALRTPFTRATKGALAKTYPEELLGQILKATVSRTGIPPSAVSEIAVGAVLQQLGGQKVSAMAVKDAGFPASTTTHTINRQCASSSQALSSVASAIRLGNYEVGIAAGVESMTMDYFPHRGIPPRVAETLSESPVQEAKDVIVPMGITSENVAAKYGITREVQDEFAVESQRKAAEAQRRGFFKHEIVPIQARTSIDPEPDAWTTVDADDGVRAGVTMEKLAKLPPAFKEGGTTTAGSSSQVTDGASAMLVMTRRKAEELGMKPIGKFVQSVVVGVPAALMGVAPAYAVPELLEKVGLSKDDIDVFELNEGIPDSEMG
jgi:acetyl-CoA acyltransferase 1